MATTKTGASLTFAVLGAEEAAQQYVRAFRGVDGVSAYLVDAGEDGLLDALSRDDTGCLVVTEMAHDVAGWVKRALVAGRHVFVAGTPALDERRYDEIDQLARRRRRVAAFDTGFMLDERLAFIRKMAAAPQALWRPRYVRSVHAGGPVERLDEIAIAQAALMLEVTGMRAERVTACAPFVAGDETSNVAMVNVMFAGGAVASVHVAPGEALWQRETVIVCDGRTVALDPFDARGPLRIAASSAHSFAPTAAAWQETTSEHAPASERLPAVAEAFCAAARARDVSFGNAAALASAAALWAAARRSIANGGEVTDVARQRPQRPELRLIKGRGRGGASAAPALTLVEDEPYGGGAA